MPALARDCLVVDKGVPASFVMMVSPVVSAKGDPEVYMGLNTGFFPAGFSHSLYNAMDSFIYLVPRKVFVFNDGLFCFSGGKGNKRMYALLILGNGKGFVIHRVGSGFGVFETLVSEEV